MPPAAAPMAAPLNAAIIGPAAMKGPTPGMAKAPIPAIHPNAPPTTPPVPAPVTAPSGAFVLLVCAKSRVVVLSGKSTEMSLLEKLAFFRVSTMRLAWSREVAMQNTDFFDIMFAFFFGFLFARMTELLVADRSGLDFQLVVHVSGVRTPIRDFTDEAFFLGRVDRPAQGDLSINRDDLHVLSVHGHVLRSENFFANLRRGGHVGLAVALIEGRECLVLTIPNIYPGIVRIGRRVGGEIGLNLVGAINVTGVAGLTKVRPLVGFE